MRSSNKQKISGQGMTEYIIIVALVAIAGIAIVETFGQTVRGQIGKITKSMQGEKSSDIKFEKVTKKKTGEKTLKNYADNR